MEKLSLQMFGKMCRPRLMSLMRNYEIQPFGPENIAIIKGRLYTAALFTFSIYIHFKITAELDE
jgi:hypothetical protein